MRILHVIPSLSIQRGGPSTSLRQLARAQLESGLEVGVLTTNDDCDGNSDWPLGSWFDIDGVPVMAFDRRLSPQRWLREHIVSKAALQWLDSELHNWDLLHVHAVFSYLTTGAMRLARNRSRPYICRPLGQLCQWSLAQKSFKKKLYLRLLERANLAAASRVHFTSEKERREFQQLHIKATPMVVPHGIHLPESQDRSTASRPGPPTLLSLSRVDEKKGLDLLIRGFALLLAQFPEARLVIAGSGDSQCEASLKQLAADLGLAGQVRFTGWVDGAAKQDLLAQASVFALASHSENFGVAVVEALAWGLPVLVTEGVALCPDVLQAGAGIEIGYQPESIAAAAAELLDNSEQRARMSANAQRLARDHFGWPAIVAAISQHYQAIVSRHAA